MLFKLFQFEIYYFSRKPMVYITMAAFFAAGLLLGMSEGASFPNIHFNSPYQIAYLVGILSLGTIFSLTLLVAESILREKESGLDQIIFASPLSKRKYLLVRLLALAGIGLLSFAFCLPGLALGYELNAMPALKFGHSDLADYLWPFLLLALSNILLSTAILCCTAWFSGNKLLIYISGLFIYIIYIVASIFSNSPLLAGSAPVDPAMVSLSAKLDPFGLASFFEQTRYWSAPERNSRLLEPVGNLLLNRLIWICFSILLIVLSLSRFSFSSAQAAVSKKEKLKPARRPPAQYAAIRPVQELNTRRHCLSAFLSFSRIHLFSVLKGRPFLLIFVIWSFLLGIELKNAIGGDPRLGTPFVSSGLLINTIADVLPVFALLVILFYSSELLWKSRTAGFSMIEGSTAVNPIMEFLSKLFVLFLIISALLIYSCLTGLLIQAVKGTTIDFGLYLSLFYFLGSALLLSGLLALSIQVLVPYKYPGLALAAVLILLSSSPLGSMIGISNPLFRLAEPLKISYAEMNGYGGYVHSFGIRILYSAAFAAMMVLGILRFTFRKKLSAALMIFCSLIFVASGTYIYYETFLRDSRPSGQALNDWKQEYEEQYSQFKHLSQPSITSVRTEVDLFPNDQRYQVRGSYRLVNKSRFPIDSLLIAVHPETRLHKLSVLRKGRRIDHATFAHYWYLLDQPLLPGESMDMNFSFSSGWTGFKGHSAFNSIIGNGSFIRMSNYFPRLGYDNRNEISNSLERRMRGMAAQDELPQLRGSSKEPYDYQFIDLNAVISTDADQVVIGQGILKKQWKQGGRNYLRYQTDRPIPFRFAVSSARYRVHKDKYRDIDIEVYYHPGHPENVGRLVDQAKQTLAYCEKNFAPYPHPVIRFAEVSAFAEGFGATAYPTTIYMKEDGGFHTGMDNELRIDVINQLAGHELSHEWWGSAQMSPEVKEGGWVMTETLAKYTESMLLLHARGPVALRRMVGEHLEQYASLRSFSKETALYKTTYETPHLPYNKGSVVMYQLYQLIGEKAINRALNNMLKKYSYPMPPPDTEDLLNELYKVSNAEQHGKIDELFKQILTYDLKMGHATVEPSEKQFKLVLSASAGKFFENGKGQRKPVGMHEDVEVLFEMASGKKVLHRFIPASGIIKKTLVFDELPVKIVLDPYLKYMDVFQQDNELAVAVQGN